MRKSQISLVSEFSIHMVMVQVYLCVCLYIILHKCNQTIFGMSFFFQLNSMYQ